LQRNIGRVQGDLSETLEAIGDRVAPKKVVARTKETVAEKLEDVRDHVDPTRVVKRRTENVRRKLKGAVGSVMGSAPDTGSAARSVAGRSQELPQRAGEAATTMVQGVRGVPEAARRRAEGNPLAAGLVALGAGMLAASLLPRGDREQQAIERLKEQLEPVRQQALQAGRTVASELGETAQLGVGAVKERATQAVEEVKDQAQTGVAEVKGTAQDSAQDLKDEAVSKTQQVKEDAVKATTRIQEEASQ